MARSSSHTLLDTRWVDGSLLDMRGECCSLQIRCYTVQSILCVV